METSNSARENTKKIIPFIVMGMLIIICLAIIFILWQKINLIEQDTNERMTDLERDINTQNEVAQSIEIQNTLQDMISAVFDERTASIDGNEDLNSVCLNNVASHAFRALKDAASDFYNVDISSIDTSVLEETIIDLFIGYFENEDNFLALSSSITDRSSLSFGDITENEDGTYSIYVTVHHIDIYEVSKRTCDSFFSQNTGLDIFLGGKVGALSNAAKIVLGDLSLYLDVFSEKCGAVKSDCIYGDTVTFTYNESTQEWEISDFPIELLYAYYGVSMVAK